MNIDYNISWPGFQKAACVEWGCWCEAPRIGNWILEPVNTWSNLSFIFFGIFILHRAYIKKDPAHILRSPFFTLVFSIGLIFLGLGSGFFHASRTFWGNWIDVLGMYVISLFFLIFNFVRTQQLNQKSFIKGYLALLGVSAIFLYFATPFWMNTAFGVQLLFTFMHCLYIQRKLKPAVNIKYIYAAAGLFLVAFISWNLDRSRIVCFPWAPMNGHGIWHLLNGPAAYLVYRFFTSDKTEN